MIAAAAALAARPAPAQTPSGAPSPTLDTAAGTIAFSAGVDVYYAYNFARPANRLTSYRAFDDRHDTFAPGNVAASVAWRKGPVAAKLALQLRTLPALDPLSHLQEATLAYDVPFGHGLKVEAGIFTAPVGVESIAAREDWNWSRSNLFLRLPIQATGARVAYAVDERWSTTFAIYNGWNGIVDGNGDKSIAWSLAYLVPEALRVQVTYFGGIERARDAPEGPGWRHLVDALAVWQVAPALQVAAHGDVGFEVTRFGDHTWAAAAAYARVRLVPALLWLAARGDVVREEHARSAGGASSPILFPADWLTSATGTLDLRPHENVSFRLELRHDAAQAPLYFGADAPADVPTRRRQTTLALAALVWF